MGKAKWGIKGSDVDEVEDSGPDFEEYEGPDLTKGVYPVVLEALSKTTFNSGNEGFFMRLRVKAPKGHPKEAYNGAPLWDRIAVIDSQMWKLKPFLAALGGSGKDLDNTMLGAKEGDNEPVTRLGSIGNPVGKEFRVSVGMESYEGGLSAKVNRYMPPNEEQAAGKKKSSPASAEDEAPAESGKKAAKAKSGKKKKDSDPPF